MSLRDDFAPSTLPEGATIKETVAKLNSLIVAFDRLRKNVSNIEKDLDRLFYDKFYQP
ncbi:MAG TPA: hypothetical protein VJ110_01030 [Candidatus Nanoarchaeia archaeon]|nr:hypothetical protein [Candidatus Nanoarchaeia archaeon]